MASIADYTVSEDLQLWNQTAKAQSHKLEDNNKSSLERLSVCTKSVCGVLML